MAKLKAEARKKLPKSDFGEPGKRAYPMPDKPHARNAKARASEMESKGRISKSTEAKIDAKANRKLGKKPRDEYARKPTKFDRDAVLARKDME
jgi:hypothetical protein